VVRRLRVTASKVTAMIRIIPITLPFSFDLVRFCRTTVEREGGYEQHSGASDHASGSERPFSMNGDHQQTAVQMNMTWRATPPPAFAMELRVRQCLRRGGIGNRRARSAQYWTQRRFQPRAILERRP
jgi:hypothetical protein